MLQPPRYFWEIYELYNIKDLKFDGVYFPGMLQQIPKLLALFFVVAFGSSLDVAAIQADSPEPLDYNHELKTVGALQSFPALYKSSASEGKHQTVLSVHTRPGAL